MIKNIIKSICHKLKLIKKKKPMGYKYRYIIYEVQHVNGPGSSRTRFGCVEFMSAMKDYFIWGPPMVWNFGWKGSVNTVWTSAKLFGLRLSTGRLQIRPLGLTRLFFFFFFPNSIVDALGNWNLGVTD